MKTIVLKKETGEDTRRRKDPSHTHPPMFMDQPFVKMVVLLKAIFRFSAIPIKL
jgi:hypothetical protein